MKSRLTKFASLFAFVGCMFVMGCANDAPEANVLDPGAKPNSPSGGPSGLDGKSKDEGAKPAVK